MAPQTITLHELWILYTISCGIYTIDIIDAAEHLFNTAVGPSYWYANEQRVCLKNVIILAMPELGVCSCGAIEGVGEGLPLKFAFYNTF